MAPPSEVTFVLRRASSREPEEVFSAASLLEAKKYAAQEIFSSQVDEEFLDKFLKAHDSEVVPLAEVSDADWCG